MPLAYINDQQSYINDQQRLIKLTNPWHYYSRKEIDNNNIRGKLADIYVENSIRCSLMEFLYHSLAAWMKYPTPFRRGGWLKNEEDKE